MSDDDPKAHMRMRGRFSFGLGDLEDNPDVIAKVMETVIVTGCVYHQPTGKFHYEAISPDFNEVEDGEPSPEYDIGVDENEKVTWTKVP